MEVDVDMLTCEVRQGRAEDALSARLHGGGLQPPSTAAFIIARMAESLTAIWKLSVSSTIVLTMLFVPLIFDFNSA